MLRRFHSRITVQSSRTKTQVPRIFFFSFDEGRAATRAKNAVVTRRRLPLLEQLFPGDKTKRCGRNRRTAGECGARHLPAQTTVTISHRTKIAVDFIPHTAAKS